MQPSRRVIRHLRSGKGLGRASSGTFGLRIANTALSFVSAVLLARVLGIAGYGEYTLSMAWVVLLGVPGVLGLDRLIVREVAKYESQGQWALIRGLLRRTNEAVAISSLALTGVAFGLSFAFIDADVRPTFWIALAMLPILDLALLRQATLQGLRKVVVGQMPEAVLRPGLVVVVVGVAYLTASHDLTPEVVMALNILAAVVAFAVGAHLLRRYLPPTVRSVRAQYDTRAWMQAALPLTLLGGIMTMNVQIGTVIVGAIDGAGSAGMYSVAARGATIISFVLAAINAPLAPMIARLYAQRDMEALRRLIARSSTAALLLTAPVGLVLIAFHHQFLSVFGDGFTGADGAFVILAVAQIFNAAMGSVGTLLIMTGHERDSLVGVGVGTALNVILTAVLVAPWGVEGAAVGRGVSLVTWNIILAWFTYRRLGMTATAFGLLQTRRPAQEHSAS